MINFREMLVSPGQWLGGKGPEADIVISSRVRLARNVENFHFHTRLEEDNARRLVDMVVAVLRKDAAKEDALQFCDTEGLNEVERQFLVERHLVSREFVKSELPATVVFNAVESVSIMINEEDHIRLQTISSGLQLGECLERANRLDNVLESRLDYSFSPRFGYLTACPTNVGTGLRASVMLHLPALALTNQIEKVYHSLAKMHLVVRGLFGEGTSAQGDFFQVSNQNTLNVSENEILETLNEIIPDILQYERAIRSTLLDDQGNLLKDKILRSLGILRYARVLKSDETLDCLSAVRLGINLGIIDDIPMRTVNDLFILCQPAHLRLFSSDATQKGEVDATRADLVRGILAANPN